MQGTNVMGILEKIASLLKSRRLWLMLAQLAVGLVILASMVAPIIGVDIQEPTDDPEELADQWQVVGEQIAAAIIGVITILGMFQGMRGTTESYTVRPPGVHDKG